jgi:hypothetical protein
LKTEELWFDYLQKQEYVPGKTATSNMELIQPHIQWMSEVKSLGHKADHSLSTTAEIKNAWSYLSTPHMLHGVHKCFTLPINKGTFTHES